MFVIGAVTTMTPGLPTTTATTGKIGSYRCIL